MKRRTKLILAGVALVMLVLAVGWAWRENRPDKPWVTLRFIHSSGRSLTNHELMALTLTNSSAFRLTCHPRTQFLTPNGWRPTVGGPPDYTRTMFTLLPGEGCAFQHRAPSGTNRWRVMVGCFRPVTNWEKRRNVWANSCRNHRLRWLGDWLAPRPESEYAFTEEIAPSLTRN